MNANVLLVNPCKGDSPPFGLLYIAAVLLKHEYRVHIAELDTYGKEDFSDVYISLIKNKIKENDYKIIGITFLTAYYMVVDYLVKQIKRDFPEIVLVVGGPHVTALPEESVNIGPDVAVIGEGESVFLQIVESISKKLALDTIPSIVINKEYANSSEHIKTPGRLGYEDINALPLPAFHLINLEHYMSRNYAIRSYWLRCGWVITSRGCPAACTFCAKSSTHGRGVRERDIGSIIEELKMLKEKFNIKAFRILDDTFVIKERRVLAFCDELMKHDLGFIWACQARVSYFTDNIAKALRNSGCVQVDFGVESGSQKVLDALKKGTSIEQTKRSFEIAHKNNLRALATIMIGNPEETWDDIIATKNLLKEIKPDYTGVFFTTPYPGTKLYEQALANNWLVSGKNNWTTKGHNERSNMFINFNQNELDKIYNMLLSESFIKTLLNYLSQKRLLIDLLKVSIQQPIDMVKLSFLLVTGRKKDFINMVRAMRIKGAL